MSNNIIFILVLFYIKYIFSCFGAACSQLNLVSCGQNTNCEWINEQTGCVCASSAPIDIMFILDMSGSVEASGWITETRFVHDMIDQSVSDSSNIAVAKFDSNVEGYWDFTDDQSDHSYIADLILSKGSSFYGGHTRVTLALAHTYSKWLEFEAQGGGNNGHARLLFLLSDGRPYKEKYNPCNSNVIASTGINYKQLLDSINVKIILIGIGSGFRSSIVDCLVDDKTKQIIHVSSFSQSDFDAVRGITDDLLCPDSLSLLFTEIRLNTTWINGIQSYRSQFIEYYINGNDFSLTEIAGNNLKFNGFMSSNSFGNKGNNGCSLIFESGKYIVFYNPHNQLDSLQCSECECINGGTLTSNLCNDALFIPCDEDPNTSGCGACIWDETMTNDEWYQYVYDEATDQVISYANRTNGDTAWFPSFQGYGYRLNDIIYSADEPGAWTPSCNYTGTPGSPPLTDCSASCVPAKCKSATDGNAECDLTHDKCDCSDENHYYLLVSAGICVYLEPPENCEANNIKSPDGSTTIGSITWEYHGQVVDGMQYKVTVNGQSSITSNPFSQKGYAIIASDDVSVYTTISDPVNGDVLSVEVPCTIYTLIPTPSPTKSPLDTAADIDWCQGVVSDHDTDGTEIKLTWSSARQGENTDQLPPDGQTEYDYKIWGNYDTDTIINDKFAYDTTLEYLYAPKRLDFASDPPVIYVQPVYYTNGVPDDSVMDTASKVACTFITQEPTKDPSKAPSKQPTAQPTDVPTKAPTLRPTYKSWEMLSCEIEVASGSGPQSEIVIASFTYRMGIDIADTPHKTNLWLVVDSGDPVYAGVALEDSSQSQMTTYVPDVNLGETINANDNFVEAYIVYKHTNTEDRETASIQCHIKTQSPTPAPTGMPTKNPTKVPTSDPTKTPTSDPTSNPTPGPTFAGLTLGSCSATVNPSLTLAETIIFDESIYDMNRKSDIRYTVYYASKNDNNNNFVSINPNIPAVKSGDSITLNSQSINGFNILTDNIYVDILGDIGEESELPIICSIYTYSPTVSPTTTQPTQSPLRGTPNVYLNLIYDVDSDTFLNEAEWNFDDKCIQPVNDDNRRRRMTDDEDDSEAPPIIDCVQCPRCYVAEDNAAKFILFKREPDDFPWDITIKYKIRYLTNENGNGISSSDFDSVETGKKTAFLNDDEEYDLIIRGGASSNEKIISYVLTDNDDKKQRRRRRMIEKEEEEANIESVEAFEISIESCDYTTSIEGAESFIPIDQRDRYFCNVGVGGIYTYSGVIISIIDPGLADSFTITTTGDLPIWIWFPIGAAGILIPLVIYLIYRFYNAKKMADALEIQKKHELNEHEKQDDIGDFGVIGDNINANPLATGDAFQIPKQDKIIQHQLKIEKMNFEMATVQVEQDIFKQDFGPVQAEKHADMI